MPGDYADFLTRPMHYVLDGTIPVPEPDLLTWAAWFEMADRRVAYTEITETVQVSTVFLGLDHGFPGPPLLFETMVFQQGDGGDMTRYTTWAEAEQGHAAMVERMRAALR